MIKVIYFDIGGVIVTDGFEKIAALFAKELDIDEQKIYDAHLKTADWKQSVGKDYRARWRAFVNELGRPDVDIDHLIELAHTSFVPIQGTLDIISQLKGKFILGILSDQTTHMKSLIAGWHFLEQFDIRMISYELGHSKDEPDTPIYDMAIEKAGVKPEEILFIDNLERNIKDSSAKGIQTILFKSPEQLKAELVSKGILR
ncbi:HAD family hydrolase [Thermoproteota archaeon]